MYSRAQEEAKQRRDRGRVETLSDFDDVVDVLVDLEGEAVSVDVILRVHDLAREGEHCRRVRLGLEVALVGGAALSRGLNRMLSVVSSCRRRASGEASSNVARPHSERRPQ